MNFTKNWKTTVAGLAVGVVTVLSVLHIITAEQAIAITGALSAFGLAVAKDSNVTGGTKEA